MINFDFDDVVFYVKMYYRVAIGIAVIVALYLCIWLFKGYAGREEVKQTITEIKQTAEHNEQRVNDIIEATKAKEATVKNETANLVSSSSADALPDILEGLLRDYRNGR